MNNTNGSGSPVPPPQGDNRYAAPGQPTQPVQEAQAAPHHAQHSQQAYYQQPAYQSTTTQTTVKKSGGAKTFLLGFAGAALACIIALAGFGIYNASNGSGDTGGSSSPTVIGSTNNGDVDAADDDATLAEAVAQKALPSVVAIDVYTSQSSGMYGYGSGSGSDSGSLTQSSLGSGVVLSEDGYIVTNYHVVSGGEAFKVTIEGEQYDAEVVGTDPSSDLAVIKAQGASGLTPVEIGDSSDLIIGEWVMTIGSPFGLEQSVATGIVSATSRSQIMNSQTDGSAMIYANLIQTDAAINPGNSGGALVDADGKLIGINTLITSYSGNYSGVGFAIPVNYAVNIAQQIIDGKTPSHAQLGVSLSTVNDQIAQRYGLAVNQGAYVANVSEGSGAADAGIEVGDIITKFNGNNVTSADELMLEIRALNPGDTAEVEINRNGQTQTLEVTLGSDDSSQSATQQQSNPLRDLLGGNGGSGSNNAVSYTHLTLPTN